MMTNQELLLEIAQRVQEAVNAETAAVALAEDEGKVVYYAAAVGKFAEAMQGKRSEAATSGLCGTAFQSSCPVLVAKTEGDERVRQDYVQAWGIKTALAIPLYNNHQLLGALMVLNRMDGSLFDSESEKILVDLANEITPMIAQAVQS
ncbi:putative phytochrome sensor protein [Gloeothece citriformis PCC 7424]|uniref:Putative phytochrome sensor protein n=1 Tax=Gloeothece citriformis (strain PCC 7424) TaxID=65393 RepID=B7KED8_GLOC7|nr:GAF domain-containing protein [Gloeothece citriformis]ACK73256.1 putative phytochrome sensor protein [Gloeothece citriformis PCC 7424]